MAGAQFEARSLISNAMASNMDGCQCGEESVQYEHICSNPACCRHSAYLFALIATPKPPPER